MFQLHESGSKSDSEQLGYDLYKEEFARDILQKKLSKKSCKYSKNR